jgi:Ca2+-binding RTX toxin-like protein
MGMMQPASAAPAPVGNDFVVTPGDLAFILKQIKIAERHTTTLTASNPCGTLVNHPGDGIPDAEQVPDYLTSYGLRLVDGSCNNLRDPSTANFAAANQTFPRLTKASFRDADTIPGSSPFLAGPCGGTTNPNGTCSTSYKQTHGNVVDSQPRVVSNLIVDQTSTNPSAVHAAGFPVRTQSAGEPTAVPCTTDPVPENTSTTPPTPAVLADPPGCTPSHKTLFIPNVTTDVGLSPPYNSIFTFFGQFFDHGVDQTVKTGDTVFVPLQSDDPLITLGPDGKANTGDEVPASQAFMVLTRAQVKAGPDGVLGTDDDGPDNTDTPWVDQSQTYTSHASHQVFLREYVSGAGTPGPNNTAAVATGKLLTGLPADQTYPGSPDMVGGESTWASVKKQSHDLLGLQLKDIDVVDIPMLQVDPYGKYLPGPHGLPQYVCNGPCKIGGNVVLPSSNTLEGDLANPVPVPDNAVHFETPFVGDLAHNADPSAKFDSNGDHIPDALPVADSDSTVQTDFSQQPFGTYDDELLSAHAACGDGRCNENIALTSIHQVFHSEHNRLVDYIKNVLENDTSPAGIAALAQWKATGVAGANGTGSYGYGERLFQAARFVTEMEYQHLVFEEFARKVQPAVRPFHVYSPDINPAIEAEFAHAVYRFGHSMLDDDVARTNVDPATGDKTDNSLPLLTAFLNPPELYNGGSAGTLNAAQGAGSVFMGSSDQTGNEIDEFVTETLRNNLLGLPLDLPTINMTRAREAGVAPLNEVRREIFAETNDGQLAPYTSWTDYGQHLRHPESLINFVAAYGTHPSIVNATTLVAKRDAARAIVDPLPTDVQPADAADFMFGTGAWADNNGVTTTGLDDVDLWVGGLAEVTNLFGGLLGTTFNYVFQTQLEKLQDGDRLYYLARTPGMNLRTQLEGNSFSEMIQRNTEGTNSLKADAFATADCRFQLGHIHAYTGTPTPASSLLAPPIAPITAAGAVDDDASTTDCDENQLLLRKPDGTVQYRAVNAIDPVGINGQAVYNGTPGADRVVGGNDNDTFWGGLGKDVIEGNGGDDIALGGEGNDIITDLGGADVPKGGPGNDAVDAGIGDDIPMGNAGSDFINGGANDNESFAGPGNDFAIAGQGADAVFGDAGDDWIEGGTGQDLLQGDHGAPFFDDPAETAPGNDIFVGQIGENDYDAEGGDDLMAQNSQVDRNAGAGGFDWAFHQYDTVAANDDLMINNNLGGLPIQVIVNRDRWQETEADSGSKFNDTILGTDNVLANPRLISGGGFSGCDAIDQAGVNRIKGLAALLPPVANFPGTAAETASLSASGFCPLEGKVWGEGDILLGGPGSDTITGRAGDEIIDGDKELTTAIAVTDGNGNELGRTDLMEGKAAPGGNFGPGTAGMTLQQAVFAGLVDPGNLVDVRQIDNTVTAPADCGAASPVNCDTAAFAGPSGQYTVTTNAQGVTVVTDTTSAPPALGVAAVGDGSDTLTNIEQLRFTNTDGSFEIVPVADGLAPPAPVNITALALNGAALVTWAEPGGADVASFDVKAITGGTEFKKVTVAGSETSAIVTGLTNGTTFTFRVRANGQSGHGSDSDLSSPVTPQAPVDTTAPSVTNRGPASSATNVPTGTLVTATFSEQVQGVSGTTFTLKSASGTAVSGTVSLNAAGTTATLTPNAPLASGTQYTATLVGGSSSIRDMANNGMSSTSWSFTTAVADKTAPKVSSRTPGPGAKNVSTSTKVVVGFSEQVKGVSGSTVVLTNLSTGKKVTATVTLSATGMTATLTPSAKLANGRQFKVQLTNGISDMANNKLGALSWKFTT